MTTLPVHISKRMVAVFGHVENALKLLEAFASKFDVNLYRGGAAKHEYLHDFTLMLAIDDLSSLSLTLFDGDGNPQIEHVVDMRIDDERGESPLLDFFRNAVHGDVDKSTPDEDLPPITHASFSYTPKGKGLIDAYRPFFAINWVIPDSDGVDEPIITTKSNCDDVVPEPLPAPSRALSRQRALQLPANTAALPNYAD